LGLAGFVLGFAIAIGLSRIWSAIRPVIPVITRTINPSRTVAGPSRMATGCGCSGK
jgi:hypothetical protein